MLFNLFQLPQKVEQKGVIECLTINLFQLPQKVEQKGVIECLTINLYSVKFLTNALVIY